MQRRVLLINSKLNKQKQNQQKQLKKKHNRGNRTLSMKQYSELKKT